jgi:SAM-dependent methyltransferase
MGGSTEGGGAVIAEDFGKTSSPRRGNPMTTHSTPQCFAPSAESYDRMMGRYLPALAPAFADAAAVRPGLRMLDVGCGPGGLTVELVRRSGADRVAAVDPTPSFVEACRSRNPGVDVRQAAAESLPFADGQFGAALASLVVGFMQDPATGIREMARVTAPGGIVAACFWHHDQMPALGLFWRAASSLDPSIAGDLRRPGAAEGELSAMLAEAGLVDIESGTIGASADYADFGDWWAAYTLGVGPIGAYYQSLLEAHRQVLREECRELLGRPAGPFTLEATAWFARGAVAGAKGER